MTLVSPNNKPGFLILLCLLLGGGLFFPEFCDSACKNGLPHPAFQKGMVYEVIFKGLDNDPDLLDLLMASSELVTLEDKPPPTMEGIKYRILSDTQRLKQVLASQGYYASTILPFIRAGAYAKYIGKIQIIMEISLGKRATISDFTVSTQVPLSAKIEDAFSYIRDALLFPPAYGIAENIKSAELQLTSVLSNNGYPLNTLTRALYTLTPATQTMTIQVNLSPGPLCLYGPVTLHGLTELAPSYLMESIPWKQGDIFSAKDIEKFRNTLRETNLFSSIEINPQNSPEKELPPGPIELPITITVKEGPPHYVGAGVGYTTSEGMSARTFWGHRNLWGGGEKLDIRGQLGYKKSFADANLRLPHFGSKSQGLVTFIGGMKERTEAYQKRGIATSIQLERKLAPHWKGLGGVSYEFSRISTTAGKKNYPLPGLPLGLTYSTVESLLNPTQGVTFDYQVTPYPSILGNKRTFSRIFLQHLIHVPLDRFANNIFSAYTNLGFMPGGSRSTVPPDKLFYAGGGGSVRGYASQMAGPLDAQNDPLGGISAFEAGLEMLHKISSTVAVVAFVEGANVYNQTTPCLSHRLFWGVGGGIRYYTSFAPIRFDVAFPLHRRGKIDSPFQIYIGLGQAF